jgi:hypothetical protein
MLRKLRDPNYDPFAEEPEAKKGKFGSKFLNRKKRNVGALSGSSDLINDEVNFEVDAALDNILSEAVFYLFK